MIRSFHSMQAANSIIEIPSTLTIDDFIVPDVLLKIFSLLNFQDLSQCISLVSKKWEVLANDPGLLKEFIWGEAFNPTDWNRIFPDIELTEFDCKYAFDSLPKNIGAMFKGPCPTFPNKKLGQTHVFVWMPKNLSINKFKALVKNFFPERPFEDFIKIPNLDPGQLPIASMINLINDFKKFEEYRKNTFRLVIDGPVADVLEDDITPISEWLIMPKYELLECIGGTYPEHQKIVNALELSNFKSCSFPTVLEAAISIGTVFFKTGRKILNSHAIFCKETINDSPISGIVCGGSFFVKLIDDMVSNDMSSAPIRKFKSVT